MVFIKVISNASNEANIARLLSSKDPFGQSSHCVRVLDIMQDPVNPSNSLLVMPYLRPFYDPPFEVVEQILDFIKQTLEVGRRRLRIRSNVHHVRTGPMFYT